MLTVEFDRLNIRKDDVVLDSGCGHGRHSREFAARGARVCSMDLDMASLEKTRELLVHDADRRAGTGGFMVLSGDALKLPFRDGTFDSIVCAEVLEHVSDDGKACRELARVLKKNGRLAITVPTYFSEAIYDALTYEYFSTPGGHVRKYLPGRLAAMVRESGLEIYHVDFRHSFHTLWWIIRSVVGLHLGDHPFTRAYHRFLFLTMASPLMSRLERIFDYFTPKSMIIYSWKK